MEQALAQGMATGDRDILAAANAQWRSSYPPCWAGTAACITPSVMKCGPVSASSRASRPPRAPVNASPSFRFAPSSPAAAGDWYTLVQRFADPRSPGALSYNGILDGIIARNLIPGTPVVEKVDETYADRSYLLGSLTVQYASSRFLSVEHRATYMQLEGALTQARTSKTSTSTCVAESSSTSRIFSRRTICNRWRRTAWTSSSPPTPEMWRRT